MKKALLTTLIILLSTSLFANNSAKQRLDKVIDLIKSNTIETNFKMTVKNAGNNQNYTTKGKITLHKDNFVLTTEQLKIFFNGKTQWVYSSQINEVTITNPTRKELAEVNPLLLLNDLKHNAQVSIFKTKVRFMNEETVLIKPKSKKSIFSEIYLRVNKTTNYPTYIETKDRKGNIIIVKLNNTKKVKVSSKHFNFNENKYRDLEINDLR